MGDVNSRRLLVVAPYAVVPPRYGGPLRVYNLCRELSKFFTVAQFAQQVQRRHVGLRLDPVITRVTPTYEEYSSRNPLSIGLYALTSLKWGVPPFWQNTVLRYMAPGWLRRHIALADIIEIEQPWQFAWVYHQARGRVPIVLNTQNVEADLYQVAQMTIPSTLALRVMHLIEQQERFAVTHASHIVTCSAEDTSALVARYGVSPECCTVVPNGVDCQAFAPVEPDQREQRKAELGLKGHRVVLFAGSLHRPNVDAVNQIVEIARMWPDQKVCFLIVGTVGNAFTNVTHPALRFTGSVEATRPFFEAADIAINPMRFGSGTNLKQLEFMAMGLPTLVTPTGARGLGLIDGVHAYVCPLERFAVQLRWMIKHPEETCVVGITGRRLVEVYFDWVILAERLAHLYNSLLSCSH